MAKIWARVFALIVLMMATPSLALEYISSYHSVIDVAENGELTVTETITAYGEGNRIQRGIYRDFPLYRMDENGRRTKVGFEVLSVERDGSPEDWRTESISGGIRIFTGNADRVLRTGEHVYQITYQTDRQIYFAQDYADLTWNVTGNGWEFPINEISATVVLPLGTKPLETKIFTGRLGERNRDARVQVEDNEVYFASTRAYASGEGMTVAVKIPQGVIAAPDSSQEWSWWLRDNLSAIIALGGAVVIFFYYYRAWSKVGRDPPSGAIVPRWDIPGNLSPALINYIDNKGFRGEGWEAFSAAALNLAVKGYVTLEDRDKTIKLQRSDKPADGDLQAGERSLLQDVDRAGGLLVIDKTHGETVKKAGENFRSAIEKEHRGKYYQHNRGYVIFGALMSLVAVIATIAFEYSEDDISIIVVSGFLLVFGLFVGRFALNIGRDLFSNKGLGRKIRSVIFIAMAVMFGFSAFGTLFAAFFELLGELEDVPAFIGIGCIFMLNIVFMTIMGAPTPIGQKLSEGVEGLKTYINLAEKDRMALLSGPAMSPQHYETLLPYAVALGLEKNWTKAFNAWLATATATAAAYAPTWYGGDGFGNFGDRIGGFASNMASNIQSSLPAPPPSSSGSFSSGGGGFSGSGGGGGGGGGW